MILTITQVDYEHYRIKLYIPGTYDKEDGWFAYPGARLDKVVSSTDLAAHVMDAVNAVRDCMNRTPGNIGNLYASIPTSLNALVWTIADMLHADDFVSRPGGIRTERTIAAFRNTKVIR